MATSGTYSFTETRDGIINSALRSVGAFGAGDVAPAPDITNCAEALNIIIKAMVMRGMPLWCVQTVVIPTIAGQATYSLGTVSPAPGTNTGLRPLRILDAFLRSSTGNDVMLTVTSRWDYDTLGQKAQPGVPNQLYYDAQLGNGLVSLYDVPVDTTNTIYLSIQRQIQDVNVGTDNLDFPQEAFQMLKWALVDEIGLEYGATAGTLQIAAMKAKGYVEEFMAWNQEYASVFFTPSQRKM